MLFTIVRVAIDAQLEEKSSPPFLHGNVAPDSLHMKHRSMREENGRACLLGVV